MDEGVVSCLRPQLAPVRRNPVHLVAWVLGQTCSLVGANTRVSDSGIEHPVIICKRMVRVQIELPTSFNFIHPISNEPSSSEFSTNVVGNKKHANKRSNQDEEESCEIMKCCRVEAMRTSHENRFKRQEIQRQIPSYCMLPMLDFRI